MVRIAPIGYRQRASALIAVSWLVCASSATAAVGEMPVGTIPRNVASSDEASWEASLGALYSDNVARSSNTKQSSVSPRAELSGTFARHRERLTAELDADVSYVNYSGAAYRAGGTRAEQVNSAASLMVVGALVPERIYWHFRDDLGMAPISLASPDTPFNRQRTNVFETGPRVYIPLGSRNLLQLSATYFASSFGASEADGKGEQGSAALVRRMSSDSTLALQFNATRIRYPQIQSSNDFEIRSAFLNWNRNRGRSAWQVQLGTMQIKADNIDQSSPLAQVTFSRQISRRSRIAFSAGRNYSSAALAFQDNQTFFGVSRSLNSVQGTADPFRSDFGRFMWRVDGNRLQVDTQLDFRREIHKTDPILNLKLYGIEASVGRALSSRLSVSVGGDYIRKQFYNRNIVTLDRRIGAGANYYLTPTLAVSLRLDRRSGGDDSGVLTGVENTAELRLTYRSKAR